MTSSIKIQDTTKRELENLRARILLDFGKKFTHQELLDLLVQLGHDNIDQILSPMKKIPKKTIKQIKSIVGS